MNKPEQRSSTILVLSPREELHYLHCLCGHSSKEGLAIRKDVNLVCSCCGRRYIVKVVPNGRNRQYDLVPLTKE